MLENEIRKLDQFDRKILELLEQDGRLPITRLADQVGLSKSPCQVRLKRLIEKGYIKQFRAILDPALMRREHVAFAEVKLSSTTEQSLREFNDAVCNVAEVEQCHMIAGSFDYLLKIRSSDIQAYRRILGETVSALPHVAHTSTFVSMQAVKE